MKMMCAALGVARSSFYAWTKGSAPSTKDVSDAELLKELRVIHEGRRGTYGARRMRAELASQGVRVGRRRIARIMRENGMVARVRRRTLVTTTPAKGAEYAPNRLERRFAAERPDQVWVGDITYLRTREGFAYLAVVLDLHTRLVVGWAIATHMRAELVQEALRSALDWRTPCEGAIFHSDRGSQYTSRAFREQLLDNGILASMSRSGNCLDNAVAESFFGTLKQECAHWTSWESVDDAREEMQCYIEGFYNRRRLHSGIGYMTPWDKDLEAA